VREITFKRSVDASSAAFMSNLVAGRGYESASLIKRKSTGGKTDAKKTWPLTFTCVSISEWYW